MFQVRVREPPGRLQEQRARGCDHDPTSDEGVFRRGKGTGGREPRGGEGSARRVRQGRLVRPAAAEDEASLRRRGSLFLVPWLQVLLHVCLPRQVRRAVPWGDLLTSTYLDVYKECICMVTQIARVWINWVRSLILLVTSWTGKMIIPLSPFAPENYGEAAWYAQWSNYTR